MNTTELVHFVRPGTRPPTAVERKVPPSYHQLVAPVRQSILRARHYLLNEQRHDGAWIGRRQSDASLISQTVLLRTYLADSVECDNTFKGAAAAILEDQLSGGGWSLVPGGPPDLSVSVQAYFALKLAGYEANDERLSRARDTIRRLGGADGADATSRFYLALLGQAPRECCAEMNAARYAVRNIGLERGIRELFLRKPSEWPACGRTDLASFEERLGELITDDVVSGSESRLRGQPLADTAAALVALGASGMLLDHEVVARAANWLRGPARRKKWTGGTLELVALVELLTTAIGDRESDDALPPDLHVTQLRSRKRAASERRGESFARGAATLLDTLTRQILAKQNRDGGWGAGDTSSADVTGAILVALSQFRSAKPQAAMARGAAHLRAVQRADGCWDSATGVRLIHGTSLAVRGLIAAGIATDDDTVAAGINWLLVHQHATGGWGEAAPVTNGGYVSDEFAAGPATAMQTAWGVLALTSAGREASAVARQAVDFLVETQQEDGAWDDPQFVLCDSDVGRWYRDTLSGASTALVALSRWAVAAAKREAAEPARVSLRMVGTFSED